WLYSVLHTITQSSFQGPATFAPEAGSYYRLKNHHPGDFMDIKHSFGSRIFAALATLALTAGTVAVAQQTSSEKTQSTQSTQSSTTSTKPSKAERKEKRKERKDKMAKELGLTADQKKQLDSTRDDQR